MRYFIVILLTILSIKSGDTSARVRHVVVKGDQIITVRTAVGIATIIQVPDRPNSVVVGDQESFKVEYLDQAITIKPLSNTAKTNLYIYTDWRRFNVELVSGKSVASDYVVYLENPKEIAHKSATKQEQISWMYYKKEMSNEGLIFETKRVAKVKSGLVLIEFHLRSEKKINFDPGWIWVKQAGRTRPIQNLILGNLHLSQKYPSQGILQILANDLNTNEAFKIELRRKTRSSITIKRITLWK